MSMSNHYRNLRMGDWATRFRQRTLANPNYAFDTVGGRYVVLCFYGSTQNQGGAAALEAAFAATDIFDDSFASFFGVVHDRADIEQSRVAEHYPGYRFFIDLDGRVGRAFGALPLPSPEGPADEQTSDKQTNDEQTNDEQTKDEQTNEVQLLPRWVLLDPMLRVLEVIPFTNDSTHIELMLERMRSLPPVANFADMDIHPPVLMIPRVFPSSFCDELIAHYRQEGGEDSGFMTEVDGMTIGRLDHTHKRRRDLLLTDETFRTACRSYVERAVVPAISQAYQFQTTRLERYLVARYGGEEKGHFRQHRDNTTKGTAHRRFAVSIFLNEGYEGGAMHFPEYSQQGYRMNTGGALVFSCSMLHTVRPVTAGERFVFLPFLYDEAAADIRDRNMKYVADEAAKPPAEETTSTLEEN